MPSNWLRKQMNYPVIFETVFFFQQEVKGQETYWSLINKTSEGVRVII